MVYLNKKKKKNIKVIGKTENKMEKENFIMIKLKFGENVQYKMVEELNGLMNKLMIKII